MAFHGWGRRNILLASFVTFFVAYLGFARTRGVIAIAVLFVFYGLFQGTFRSVGKALASDFVPELLRASAVGWYSAVVGFLELVASIVAGLLWTTPVTLQCFITVRSLWLRAASDCSFFQENTTGPPLKRKV
jgi:MFS family permease